MIEEPQKRPTGAPKGNRNAEKHGLRTLKRALNRLGTRRLDQRTQVARALAAWRGNLVADLGGEENLSAQQLVLVEHATRLNLILESVDGWLFTQAGLVNRRSKTLFPIVRERVLLVTTLKGLLEALGLERKRRELPALPDYLKQKTEAPARAAATEQPRREGGGTAPAGG